MMKRKITMTIDTDVCPAAILKQIKDKLWNTLANGKRQPTPRERQTWALLDCLLFYGTMRPKRGTDEYDALYMLPHETDVKQTLFDTLQLGPKEK